MRPARAEDITRFMSLASNSQAGPEMKKDLEDLAAESYPVITWPTLPDLPRFRGSTILDFGLLNGMNRVCTRSTSS